jgi:hypothetical protein
MVIRIDPRIPLVWRTPDTLQLGVDHPVVVPGVSAALETVVAALRRGIPLAAAELLGVDAGASPEQVRALLTVLGPTLIDTQAGPGSPASATAPVCVDGDGPTAHRLCGLLTDGGLDVHSRSEAAAAGEVVSLAVLIGHYALVPGRHAFWLRRDIPHLPVVFSDTEVRIGPLVTPGCGPCLYCLELTHTDADTTWPRIASQLQGKLAPTETARLSIDIAGRTAVYVQSFLDGEPSLLLAHSLAVNGHSGALTLRAHRSHGSCACQSLPENGTAPEEYVAAGPLPPSSAPAGFWPG